MNWCPSDNTVLANEQVVDGGCWRCGTPVETRDLEQWFFRITAYADELLDATVDADAVAREGSDDAAELDRAVGRRAREVPGRGRSGRRTIEVFTTRIDTIFGATFVLLAPEHPLVATLRRASPPIRRRSASRRRRSGRRIAPRASAARSRSRASTPASARSTRSPAQPVPIWVANFVLGEYGTGAVMAVPAHDQRDFEFARKYNLPIRVVVHAGRQAGARPTTMTEADADYGTLVDSGEYSGLSVGGRAEAHDRARRSSAASARARCSTG